MPRRARGGLAVGSRPTRARAEPPNVHVGGSSVTVFRVTFRYLYRRPVAGREASESEGSDSTVLGGGSLRVRGSESHAYLPRNGTCVLVR